MEITHELLDRLIVWQKSGYRSVDIKIEPDNEPKVWVYDYSVPAGIHLKSSTDALPTTEELQAKELAAIQAKMDAMSKKEAA